MHRFLLAVLLVANSFVAAGQKHPFTFEDMMGLKRVEEPEVSPDGKWVLFAAVDVDLKANTKTPHVWVFPLGGETHVSQKQGDTGPRNETNGREREIISDQDADRLRWAPDGKRFAFVSTKEGGSQIWIADFDGASGSVTAKYRLTNTATEADGELWSPDGKNILFKSDVYPECDGRPAEETACNAKKLEEAKNSKVKAQIFTHLMYRHWNAYRQGKRSHLFVIEADPGTIAAQLGNAGTKPDILARDLSPGNYDAPVFSVGGQDDYAFSPDGQEICYASNHDQEPAISTNNDLFIVPVSFPGDATSAQVVAATKDITADNKAADNTPLYSPDGNYIAYRAQARAGYESDRWRLMLYERKTRGKRNLTNNFDVWVGTIAWEPSSKAVYFTGEERGADPLFRAGVSFPYVVRVMQGTYDDLNFSSNGKTLLLTQMSATFPNRIVAVQSDAVEDVVANIHAKLAPNVAGGIETITDVLPRVLADPNDQVLSNIEMSPLESFWFTGAHGDKVQGFLVKPPHFDPNKKYSVKFIIHGGPEVPMGDEWSYRWNSALFAANGYVVIFINFHGSPGYGQKFIDAINGDWGGAPFEDLMKGLDYAEQHYVFTDKDRECALGASYGGYMANWILGHTDRFKCIVTHDGMFDTESAWGTTEELWFNDWEFKGTPYTNRELYRKWSPHLSATNFKTPALVIHSQLDYRLDVSEGFQLFTTLQRLGVPSKMLYFPDEGHWVLKPQNSQFWYKTVNDWVDEWVGK